jgi:hypothetical protein
VIVRQGRDSSQLNQQVKLRTGRCVEPDHLGNEQADREHISDYFRRVKIAEGAF